MATALKIGFLFDSQMTLTLTLDPDCALQFSLGSNISLQQPDGVLLLGAFGLEAASLTITGGSPSQGPLSAVFFHGFVTGTGNALTGEIQIQPWSAAAEVVITVAGGAMQRFVTGRFSVPVAS